MEYRILVENVGPPYLAAPEKEQGILREF